jgi:hypothetical protein
MWVGFIPAHKFSFIFFESEIRNPPDLPVALLTTLSYTVTPEHTLNQVSKDLVKVLVQNTTHGFDPDCLALGVDVETSESTGTNTKKSY